METNYPALKRPKRKLSFLTNKKSSTKQWAGPLTLEDVDRMFDDLDSSPHDGPLPLSTMLQTFDIETNQNETGASPVPEEEHPVEKPPEYQVGPKGDVLHPAVRSPSPNQDIDLDIPFKAHGPVQTSSPIEQIAGVGEQDKEGKQVVSPILFPFEDEGKEEAKTESLPAENPQCNGQVTEEIGDSELESPPSKIALTKQSRQKNKAEASCKERNIAKAKTPKKPQTPVLKGQRKIPSRQENSEPPAVSVMKEPELAAPEKNSESDHRRAPLDTSSRIGAFLQKLKDAGQSKPACSRKFLSSVKAPTPPPEPEDDFLILEDDTPFWFSIPRKTAPINRTRQQGTFSTDKESSTDKETKDGPPETSQKRMKRRTSSTDKDGSTDKETKDSPPETSQKRMKRRTSSTDKEGSTDKETKDVPPETSQKRTKRRTSSTDKEGSTDREMKDGPSETSQKRTKRWTSSTDKEGSTDREMKDVPPETSQKQQQSDEANSIVGSQTVKQKVKKRKGKEKNYVETGPGNGEDKLSSPQDLPAGDLMEQKTPNKKKKQLKKVPSKESDKAEDQHKDGASREKEKPSRRTKTKAQKSSETKKSKSSEDEQEKAERNNQPVESDRCSSDDSPVVGKRRRRPQAGQWWLSCPESAEETDREQAKLKKHSNPLRGQRVYRRASNERKSITPASPASARQSRQQLREAEPAKRRRKPPSCWWMVSSIEDEDLEMVPSQPEQLHPKEPKPRKQRKTEAKQSKSLGLGIPKNGSKAGSSKPLGGAHAPSPKQMPPSSLRTDKRSLPAFKDILTSVQTLANKRDTRRNNRRNVTPHHVEEISTADCQTDNRTGADILGEDGGECSSAQSSSHSHKTPQSNRSNVFKSGPISMIELEQYEDNDDMTLPSSRVHAVLSASDLCAPPLTPLVLEPKDNDNVSEWFKNLWATTAGNGAAVTPDQFDWYSYQERAMGLQVDLNSGSICNGKLLLGSHMKKPLWVDHSATTVFNLLTSSVIVTIDGSKSHFGPGKSFMVQSGHAYSIHNVNAQPAVLYFTRIFTESSE